MKNLHWIFFACGSTVFLLVPIPEFAAWRSLLMVLTILFGAITLLPLQPEKIKVRWLDLVLVAFVFLQFASYLWASHPTIVIQKAMYWLSLFLLYLIARNINIRDFNLARCSTVFLILNALNYLFILGAYVQIVAGKGPGSKLSYNDINHLMGFFTTNGNYIGSLMVILFPFYFKILDQKAVNRFFLYFMMFLHIIILFSFNSKAVLLALAMSTVYIVWTRFRQKTMRKLALQVGGATMLILATIYLTVEDPSQFLYAMGPGQTITGQSSDERVAIWRQSLRIFEDNPILGVGAGNWPIEFFKYGISHFSLSFDSFRFYLHAHNLFLETLGELGFVGGLAVAFIFFFPFWLLHKSGPNSMFQDLMPYIICYLIVSSFYGVAYGPLGNFQPAQFLWIFVLGVLPSEKHPVIKEFKASKVPEKFLVFAGALTLIWSVFILKREIIFKHVSASMVKQEHQLALSKMEQVYHPHLYRYYKGNPIKAHEGLLHWHLGQKDLAVENIKHAISDSPYNPIGWIHLANMSHVMGDMQTAKIAYQKVSSINNTYFPAQIALAQIALQEEDWEAFEKNLTFYEKEILPRKDKHYSEQVWESDNQILKNHWTKICGYEDQVIDLRQRMNIILGK